MKATWTVRQRILVGFTAVMAIMLALTLFSYTRLRHIEAQATQLRAESIPALYLAGRLKAVGRLEIF